MKRLLILFSVFLLTGCSDKFIESSISEITYENMTEPQTETSTVISKEDIYEIQTESATEITEEEISLPENVVNIEEAGELILNKLHNYVYNKEPNQHLAYDSTRMLNFRPCYVFFSYDDFDDKRTVTGWYAVNPSTGECFDITTEQLPLFYRFEITEYGVEVYQKYADEPFQLLSLDPDLPNPEWLYEMNEKYNNPYQFIKVNDFDFDGYDDIAVQVGLGATNGTVQYYHYNPETQQFENWNELNSLYYGVQADIKNETLSVHSKSSAVGAEDTVYKWDGNVLIPVSMQKRYWNGDDIFVDYLEYDELGNENLVKREQLICDETGDISETIDVTP
ncbi:MAG: hypothetical protein K2G83_04655 [Ruminococcus sp.]|nr:hypothetical protein [Ruminococcus sp.]